MDINDIKQGASQETLAAAAREIREAMTGTAPNAVTEKIAKSEAEIKALVDEIESLPETLDREAVAARLAAKGISPERISVVISDLTDNAQSRKRVKEMLSDPFNREKAGKSIQPGDADYEFLLKEVVDFFKRPGSVYDK